MEGNGSTNQLGVASSPSTLSMNCDMCKICHSEAYKDDSLISPCYCSGSLLYVHQGCIQKWIKVTGANSCELCQYDFDVDSTTCPIRKWKRLELSSEERRKIVCSVTFHVVAVLCIVWSLWVLIARTVAEVHSGNLKWPFWTKLVVVAIGFIGGVVFMYVQCKVYVHLFERLKAYNRVLFVRDVPQQARDQYKVQALENMLASHIV